MARLHGARTFAVIQASAAKTATFQTPAFDEGNMDTVNVLINVTAVSGTSPSMTVNVEWSHDGLTWFKGDPADAFTAITATGAVCKQFATKGLYARLNCTISGTTPSFTFAAYSVVGS
jgi:hypothetical protein